MGLPALVVLIGVGATGVVAHRVALADATGRLERQLAVAAGDVDAGIDRIAGLVAGAAAHLSLTAHDPARMTDERLAALVDAVGAAGQGGDLVPGMSYISRTYTEDLPEHVVRRRWTMPDFTVGEGPNRVYPAVVWATTSDLVDHGARLDAHPDRSTALAEAEMTGQVVLTAPIPMPGGQRAVLDVVGPITDPRDGRTIAWIATEVDADVLLPHDDGAGRMRLAVHDNGLPVRGAAPEGGLQRTRSVELLGRTWFFTATTPTPFADIPILVAGVAITALAAWGTGSAQRARRRLASDVTDVRRSRDRYAGFLQGMIGNLELGIVACDEWGRVTVTNPAAERMLSGLAGRLETGTPLASLDLLDADGRPHDWGDLPLTRAMRGLEVRDVELDLRLGEEPRILLVNAQAIHDAEGRVDGAVAIFHDITDRKAVEARMTRLAMHDHLTGLANRRRLAEALGAALDAQRAGGPSVTLLLLDLDRFKQVNDTSGHHRGDQMLIDVAGILAAIAHDGDLAARMGGDEFVLLCPHQDDEVGARVLGNRVADALRPALCVDGESGVRSGVSIGVVRPEASATVEDVLRQADLAMYDAKRERDDSIRVYEPGLGRRAAERFATEAALRRALADGALDVAYQPIVDPVTMRVAGVEALVRWQHEGVPRPPATFVPLAEETGLITEIDLFVLDAACAAVAGGDGVGLVGVNLSARTLALPDLVDRVGAVLDVHGVSADRLVLELTEHALIAGSSTTDRSLALLSGMGVRLSLDDFGTGYASLTYLRRFPVNSIKIDRTFVTDLVTSEEDRAIVAGTIQMAARLGLRTVAEGVETAAQAALLTEMGCDLLQGHLFGWPTRYDLATGAGAAIELPA